MHNTNAHYKNNNLSPCKQLNMRIIFTTYQVGQTKLALHYL